MSDTEILFAFLAIVLAWGVGVFMPISREADLWMVDIFAIVVGSIVASMGFLAFTTHWSESGAWQSAVLIMIGALIVSYMMNRLIKHGRQVS